MTVEPETRELAIRLCDQSIGQIIRDTNSGSSGPHPRAWPVEYAIMADRCDAILALSGREGSWQYPGWVVTTLVQGDADDV